MKIYQPYAFQKAVPVWKVGKEEEMNTSLAISAEITAKTAVMHVTGASVFTVTVNGKLAAYGPARAAHTFFRVSEIDLTPHLTDATDIVTVRTVGYNIMTYAFPKNPAFVCCEILADGAVVAATGSSGFGFRYYDMDERVMRVQRYSYQRAFVENYRLAPDAFSYEHPNCQKPQTAVCDTAPKTFIRHDLPYCDYDVSLPKLVFTGTQTYDGRSTYYDEGNYWIQRPLTEVGHEIDGYTRDELEDESHVDVGRMVFTKPAPTTGDAADIAIPADAYRMVEFERDYAGLFSFDLACEGDGELYLFFDEILLDTDRALEEFRMECCNFIKWKVAAGSYRITTAEPYTMKFVRLATKGTAVRIKNLKLHRIEYPMSKIKGRYIGDDPDMQKIFDAAVATFAANATDIFMDCPSRERCAWLGDAFSTSRAEKALTGAVHVQRALLANIFEATSFPGVPEGLIGNTCPADYYGDPGLTVGAIWSALCHLYEYYEWTHDDDMLAIAKDRLYTAINFFRPYENQYGLIVDPPGALFFDWADCNRYTKGVSFLFNMWYYTGKKILGVLYHDAQMNAEADALKATILQYALNEDGFIRDHALMIDGEMVVQPTYTETAQYFAFYYHILTKKDNPDLYQRMIVKLGTAKIENNHYPEMPAAGLYGYAKNRMEILSQNGEADELIWYLKDRFRYMVERTGTIWEFVDDRASCNHGFTSAMTMYLKRIGLVGF